MNTAKFLPMLVLALAAPCMAEPKTLTVSADGSADFKSVQEAVNAAPENSPDTITIHINPGTYEGQIIIPKNKPHLTLEGEDSGKTLLTWPRNVYEPIPAGADKFNPGLNVRADNFRAEKITFQNTSGDHGQALAVRIDSDRVVFLDCRLLGWQDTLMVNNGRQYFKNCYIEGRVDFIYGSGTAVFDHCEIQSKNGGYVTAASTPKDDPYGFVFLDCRLTGDNTPWNPASTNPATTQKAARPDKLAYLGRPWRADASVAYIRCWMDDHIRPEGWHNWGNVANEQSARYAEYQTTGPGANPAKRQPWSKQLTESEASKYTLETILGGTDHWKP